MEALLEFQPLLTIVGLFVFGVLSGRGIFVGAKDDLMEGNLDLLTHDIKIIGGNAAAVTALVEATSNWLSDLVSGNRTHADGTGATAGIALGTKTVVGKTFDAANLVGTFTDPNNANGATAVLLIFRWNTAEGDSRLIAYDVLASAVNQDGTDDDVTFDASGIFDL